MLASRSRPQARGPLPRAPLNRCTVAQLRESPAVYVSSERIDHPRGWPLSLRPAGRLNTVLRAPAPTSSVRVCWNLARSSACGRTAGGLSLTSDYRTQSARTFWLQRRSLRYAAINLEMSTKQSLGSGIWTRLLAMPTNSETDSLSSTKPAPIPIVGTDESQSGNINRSEVSSRTSTQGRERRGSHSQSRIRRGEASPANTTLKRPGIGDCNSSFERSNRCVSTFCLTITALGPRCGAASDTNVVNTGVIIVELLAAVLSVRE